MCTATRKTQSKAFSAEQKGSIMSYTDTLNRIAALSAIIADWAQHKLLTREQHAPHEERTAEYILERLESAERFTEIS